MHPLPSGLDQAAPKPNPSEQRLGRYLLAATKAGISSADRRTQLLALQVPADHPHAARAFAAGVHEPIAVYVDTSRLPCDYGRRA